MYGVVGDKRAKAAGEDGEASHLGGAVERRVGALNAKKIQVKKIHKKIHTPGAASRWRSECEKIQVKKIHKKIHTRCSIGLAL